MSKRLISVILCLVLCSSMILGVSAADFDMVQSQMINVLEFGGLNGTDDFWFTTDSSGSGSATFSLPYSTIIRYVDMVVSSSKGLSGAVLSSGGVEADLTVEAVSGSTFYRVYGVFNGSWSDSFTIKFKASSAAKSYISFYSLHMSPQPLQVFASPSVFLLDDQSVTQTSGNTMVSLTATLEADPEARFQYWTSSVRNSNWRKYDYMTFTLSYYTHSINNINVQINGNPIPYTVNMVENPPSFSGFSHPDAVGDAVNVYSLSITVDLTMLQHTTSGELIVTVQGMGHFVYGNLHNGVGYIPSDLPEAEITWLQKIWNSLESGFKSVVNAITGDTSAADGFQEDVSEKSEELEHMAGVMDSVDTPDSFNPAVPEVQNVGMLVSGGGLGDVIMNPYVFPLFAVSMTLCFVSYALYGKKG